MGRRGGRGGRRGKLEERVSGAGLEATCRMSEVSSDEAIDRARKSLYEVEVPTMTLTRTLYVAVIQWVMGACDTNGDKRPVLTRLWERLWLTRKIKCVHKAEYAR